MTNVSSRVRRAVRQFCAGELTESEFETELREIHREVPGANASALGLAIQKGLNEAGASGDRSVWEVAARVNPEIEGKFDNYAAAFGVDGE